MRSPALAALLACTALACRPGRGTVDFRHNRSGEGTPVATFHSDSITAEELQQRFLQLTPAARAKYQTVDERREYVEGIARFELLAAEALRRRLHDDPEVVETTKKVMVQKLLQEELDKPAPVSDDEVRTYYQEHQADFLKPEMLRISLITLAAANDKDRAAKRAKAEELLAKAKTLARANFSGFGALARQHSDDEKSRSLNGDLRFLSAQELAEQQGEEVAKAAAALRQVGDISEVVESGRGYHLLKLQGRQPALNLTLDAVRPQIESRIRYERRNRDFAKLLETLKASANYQLDQAALEKVVVDLKAPVAQMKGPAPGFMPAPTPNR